MIVRILLWSLFDSKTTIDELRASLPALEPPSTWVWSEASERFGLIAFGDELPEAAAQAAELIGSEPAVLEEFGTL
ncbi:MAG: hypothetical protein RMM28_02630 [Thermoleophilia bacterium]|nr:hypothetical protein [Gaiellaceae bacterium]MDW8338019.1 hypothetical protein [Thermoleophilia bacterium]